MLVVGFLAASIVFLAAVFALYRPRSWVVAGILAIVVPIVVDVILREPVPHPPSVGPAVLSRPERLPMDPLSLALLGLHDARGVSSRCSAPW